jgi:hypothetical protein
MIKCQGASRKFCNIPKPLADANTTKDGRPQAWMLLFRPAGIASMSLELLHTLLCVMFFVVWAMIGQVALRRHP